MSDDAREAPGKRRGTAGEASERAPARSGTEEYRRFLWDRLQGEVYGEALFRTLAERCGDVERARKWRVLERLELETKRAIAAALVASGTAADEDADKALLGVRHGEKLARVPWLDFLDDFRAELEGLVEKFRRGESLARSPEQAAVLRRVTDHERALLEWTVREIDGRADSLDPVHAVLASFAGD